MPAPKTTKIVMPTKPTQGKGRRQPLPTALLILLIAIPLVLLSGIIFYFASGQAIIKQVEMTNYLQHKYSEKFVVSMPEYKNGGFAVEGIWKAQGYPVADPGLKFDVDSNSYGSEDQYIALIWSKSETFSVQQRVAKIFGNSGSASSAVEIVLSGKLVEDATKTSPTLSEAMKMNNGLGYNLSLEFNDVRRNSIPENAEQVATLVNEIRNNGRFGMSLRYTVRDIKNNDVYLCKAELDKRATYTGNELEKCLTRGIKTWQQI